VTKSRWGKIFLALGGGVEIDFTEITTGHASVAGYVGNGTFASDFGCSHFLQSRQKFYRISGVARRLPLVRLNVQIPDTR
jgi:hypothetical protein